MGWGGGGRYFIGGQGSSGDNPADTDTAYRYQITLYRYQFDFIRYHVSVGVNACVVIQVANVYFVIRRQKWFIKGYLYMGVVIITFIICKLWFKIAWKV